MPGNLIKLRFSLNKRPVILQCHPAARLLDLLRHEFGLKGTREGCGRGECGACQVLMNGVPVNSCLVPAFTLSDSQILTVEGIHSLKSFAEIRKLLPDSSAYRCGFCSSGMQVVLSALLMTNPEPNEVEIRQALSANLCACGNYNGIVSAVMERSSRKRRYGRKRAERA